MEEDPILGCQVPNLRVSTNNLSKRASRRLICSLLVPLQRRSFEDTHYIV